jgi:hypothetical protein
MKRILAIALILFLGACAGKTTSSEMSPADHFLGNDYALLMPSPDLKGSLVWRNPAFSPQDYSAMYVEPVVLWNAEKMIKDSGLAQEDLDLLAKYYHDVLTQVPEGTKLTLAAQPGPGVISVRSAVTEVEASSPVSNALTSVVPVGILLSAGKQMATGQAMGVGKCTIEMMFVDSVSGEKIALFADTKVGKKYSSASFTKTGQTEEAMTEWAALLKERINALWGK